MMPAARRRMDRVLAGSDTGLALITAVVVLAVLFSFSLIMLKQVINDANFSRRDQDWTAALAAAQAGVDEYVSRLNQDPLYFKWTTASPDTANPAMGMAAGKPRWANVPQVGAGAARGSYHYDVNNTTYIGSSTVAPNGNLVVTSTGRVGTRTRTIQSNVRRAGFLDFVYFTDFETQDPDESGIANCANYYGTRSAACTDIQFSNDQLRGPVHSNDVMLICNAATFTEKVSTGSSFAGPGGRNFRSNLAGCNNTGTTFNVAADPKLVPKIPLPLTNSALIAQTAPTAIPRGCLYVGPTKIVIKGPQIKVTSPWTKTLTPGCQVGTFFTIPANGTVYVDNVPSDGGSDPNSWPTAAGGLKPVCASATKNNVGYPISTSETWPYPCRLGDVFVEEEGGQLANALDGRLTIGAKNSIYVTNHIDYKDGVDGDAFLGLIAEQFVYVWNPINNAANTNLNLPGQSTPFVDARISAAMLSVQHAVTVMNYGKGAPQGTLNVTGAFTQRYRGIVRQYGGYSKNYIYDPRLRYDAPPHFLEPASSSFKSARLTELAPAYNAS